MSNPNPNQSGLTPFNSETGRAANEIRWRRVREEQARLAELAVEAGLTKVAFKELSGHVRAALANAIKERLMQEARHSAYRDLSDPEIRELAVSVLAKQAHAGSTAAAAALARLTQRERALDQREWALGMAQEAGENAGLLDRAGRIEVIEAEITKRESALLPAPGRNGHEPE